MFCKKGLTTCRTYKFLPCSKACRNITALLPIKDDLGQKYLHNRTALLPNKDNFGQNYRRDRTAFAEKDNCVKSHCRDRSACFRSASFVAGERRHRCRKIAATERLFQKYSSQSKGSVSEKFLPQLGGSISTKRQFLQKTMPQKLYRRRKT